MLYIRAQDIDPEEQHLVPYSDPEHDTTKENGFRNDSKTREHDDNQDDDDDDDASPAMTPCSH